jgi:hypothetical protein
MAGAATLGNTTGASEPRPAIGTHSVVGLRCLDDAPRRLARSAELLQLERADLDDRKDEYHSDKWTEDQIEVLRKRDLARRGRVAEIFAEGCFSTAADYRAAALVFQHGDAPDHHFQTFLWSKRGVEAGDASQKKMMAYGIDRYLVGVGKKQLFGSQSYAEGSSCHCEQPVEPSFPKELRKGYVDWTLDQRLKWVQNVADEGKHCPPVAECTTPLAPSPRGTVPGFW